MPITQSAKKALRGSNKKRYFNIHKKELLSKAVKQVKKLVAEKKFKEAEALIPGVQKIIDKSRKTGVLKANTAGRKKSRLVAMIKRAK